MDLKYINSYFKNDNISFIKDGTKTLLFKNNKLYKPSNKIQSKLNKLLGGRTSLDNKETNTFGTNTFETKKFMSIQTSFNGNEQDKCVNAYKKGLKSTNPKFPYYKQMYYIASDKQDMEKYGILPIYLEFLKVNDKHRKEVDKELKSNIYTQHTSIINKPLSYKKFNISDIKSTFQYLYKKFQKGVLVAIKDNKLVVYLPFYNSKFMNDYSRFIYINDEDKKNMEELSKLISKKSLSQKEKIRRKELSNITKKTILDFYKSKGEYLKGVIKERYKWLANDCMFVDRQKTDMTHGLPEYHYLFKDLLENRKIPDVIFFLSYRDLPILKKDKTHPYNKLHEISTNSKKNIKNQKEKELEKINIIPICTPSTGDEYATIPLITDETIKRISNKRFPKKCSSGYTKDELKGLEYNWSKKKNIAFFRGGATGCGITTETNKRLKLAEIASQNQDLFDAGITDWNARMKKTSTGYLNKIDPSSFSFGLIGKKDNIEKSKCKYIINVEGHSAAYRLNFELGLGSVILMVECRYKLWFEGLLKPNEHYIPIKGDLSDLVEKVKWCRENDSKCKKIAMNAKKLYDKYLGKEGCYDYLQMTFNEMSKLMAKDFLQIQQKNNKSTKISKLAIITMFRDNGNGKREEQKNKFIKIMTALLDNVIKNKYKIYIIEQSDDKEKFNIGKLKNIGFEIASKEDKYDNYIFTDIDIIPDSDLLPYYLKPVNGFMELAVRGSRYSYDKISKTKKSFPFMGSVISCNEESFKKINGYPNHYWGWGNEDVDLTLRILDNKIQIYTPKKGGILDMEVGNNSKEISIEDKMSKLKIDNLKNKNKKAKTLIYKDMMIKSGLKSLKYKVINKKVEMKNKVELYKVDLMKKSNNSIIEKSLNKLKDINSINIEYKKLRQSHEIIKKFV